MNRHMRKTDNITVQQTPPSPQVIRSYNITNMMKNLNITNEMSSRQRNCHQQSCSSGASLQPRKEVKETRTHKINNIKSQRTDSLNVPTSPCKRKQHSMNIGCVKRSTNFKETCPSERIYSSSSGQFSLDSSVNDKTKPLESEISKLKEEIKALKRNEEILNKRLDSRSTQRQSAHIDDKRKDITIQMLRRQNTTLTQTIEHMKKEAKEKSLNYIKINDELNNFKRFYQQRKISNRSETATVSYDYRNSKRFDKQHQDALSNGKSYWQLVKRKIAEWTEMQDIKAALEAELKVVEKQYLKLQRKKLDIMRCQMQKISNVNRKRDFGEMLRNVNYNMRYMMLRKQECEQGINCILNEHGDPIKSFSELIDEIKSIKDIRYLLMSLFTENLNTQVEAISLRKANKLLLQENKQFEQTKLLRLSAMNSIISQTDSNYEVDEIILAPVFNEGESDEEKEEIQS